MSELITVDPSKGWTGPVRMLNTSAAGMGKTSMLLSFPDVFVFDFDRALHKGVPKHIKEAYPLGNYVIIQPENWQDVLSWTMRIVDPDYRVKNARGEEFKIRTIGVDTGRTAYDMYTRVARSMSVQQIMGKGGALMASSAFLTKSDYRVVMSMSDFGVCRDRYLDWINQLKMWEGHLVFNFHETMKDAAEGSVKPALGGIDVPGSLKTDIPGLFDIFGRFTRFGDNPPSYQTVPDNLFPLKDRTGVLDPTENGLTFPVLASKLYAPGDHTWI